jgi:hypothetical protein
MAGCQQQFIKQWESGINTAQVAQAASPAVTAAQSSSVVLQDASSAGTAAAGAAGNGAASQH